jgi:hypothetical protein
MADLQTHVIRCYTAPSGVWRVDGAWRIRAALAVTVLDARLVTCEG